MVEPILNLFDIQPDVRLDLITHGQTLPDYVVVQGDTTTCMAGGLVAFHERLPVLHVEVFISGCS